jgi:tRNA (adenine57-N1/adenine58-N1)-methyltransferase
MTRTGDPFAPGETCLLSDVRDRQFLVTLEEGSTFQFDKGTLSHNDVIGAAEGSTLRSSKGMALVAMRPRLADHVLRMKRGAAVMYPKDAGALITWADIAPGCVVVEAGTGSGALTLALSRAVGPEGRVITVERREDHLRHAQKLIESFLGEIPSNIEFHLGEVEGILSSNGPDRIILDIPDPWKVVPIAAEALIGGGTFACYLPNIPQVQQVRDALWQEKAFTGTETFEVMMRNWVIDDRSVRPDHRMIGHTGFLTVTRRRLPVQNKGPNSNESGPLM